LETLGEIDQTIDQAVDQALATVTGFHRGRRVREQKVAQLAYQRPDPLAVPEAGEHRIDVPRCLNLTAFPAGRKGGQQIVAAAPLAVELTDVLRLGASELLHRQVGILAAHTIVITALPLGFLCRFRRLAEAVFVDRAKYGMGKRAGIQGRQKMEISVACRIPTDQPVELLGQTVGSRDLAGGLSHTPECLCPLLRLFRIVGERGKEIGIVLLHPFQQGPLFHGNLEELVNIQGRGIAHHIAGKVRAQHMAAHLAMAWQ
jgi:hypothetical protein